MTSSDKKPSVEESYARKQKMTEEAFLRGYRERQAGGARNLPRNHRVDADSLSKGYYWCICGQKSPNIFCPEPEAVTEEDPTAWLEGWDTADSTGRLKGEDYLRTVVPVPPPKEYARRLKYDDHPSLLGDLDPFAREMDGLRKWKEGRP